MLGKLFKHEFKNTAKLLLPLNLALIGVTLIGIIILGLKVFQSANMAMVAAGLGVLYVLAILALFIVTFVYLICRFYKSMYSAEGYLTHTLPVSPIATANVKIVVSVFWMFLTTILTALSVLSIVFTTLKIYFGDLPSWSEFCAGFEKGCGVSIQGFILWVLLLALISCFSGIITVYCSISIGQLFNKHKVIAAVITYIIFYVIAQIVNTITIFATGFNQLSNQTITSNSYGEITMQSELFNNSFVNASTIELIIFAIIYYVITLYIGSKKVNLD